VKPYLGELYEALGETGGTEGAIISRFGVGHDSIDKELAGQHRIVVTNTPGVLDSSVAEHALWLIGSLARHVAASHGQMKTGQWQPRTGIELRGQTLGILGFGSIGRRVAAMAHSGFGMRVIAAGRRSIHELEACEGRNIDAIQREFGVNEYTSDVAAMLSQADVLSIHLPAVEATQNFVSADRLASLKRDCLLVNTARGSVLDEDALYDALSTGRLAGAALDVYQREPYGPQSPDRDLRTLPNVLLTPHIGSNTVGANEAMARASLANVTNFLQGRVKELTRVNDARISWANGRP
jgi:lactate dehydrogenase-like 2-hydroxyacid dehydrogenase